MRNLRWGLGECSYQWVLEVEELQELLELGEEVAGLLALEEEEEEEEAKLLVLGKEEVKLLVLREEEVKLLVLREEEVKLLVLREELAFLPEGEELPGSRG